MWHHHHHHQQQHIEKNQSGTTICSSSPPLSFSGLCPAARLFSLLQLTKWTPLTGYCAWTPSVLSGAKWPEEEKCRRLTLRLSDLPARWTGGELVPSRPVDWNTVTKQRQSVARDSFCIFTVPSRLWLHGKTPDVPESFTVNTRSPFHSLVFSASARNVERQQALT